MRPTSDHTGGFFNLSQVHVCLSCQRGPPFNVASEPLLMHKLAASHCHHQLAHSASLYHTVKAMRGIETRSPEFRVPHATTEHRGTHRVTPLKINGKLENDSKKKGTILNNEFKSVFSESSPLSMEQLSIHAVNDASPKVVQIDPFEIMEKGFIFHVVIHK